jgi:two-component system, LytTR family, response regulator
VEIPTTGKPLARRGVLVRLRKFKDVEIVGECADGRIAVEKILSLAPDVVFLDVQMPGMDGFEVLRSLPKDNLPGVIFLTAYEQHARAPSRFTRWTIF